MRRAVYTEQQRDVALAFYATCKDVRKAARLADVEQAALLSWLRQKGLIETPSISETLRGLKRPYPPEQMCYDERYPLDIVPAPEVAEWLEKTFIFEGSLLENPNHSHLSLARIGVLWTNHPNFRQMRAVAGTAEIPLKNLKGAWPKAMAEKQLLEWFGEIPNFLITLDSVFAAEADDATFCARCEHELLHCAQKVDAFGSPKFNEETGEPVWGIRGHDVEEFVDVVRRYGVGAAAGDTAALVEAAKRPPLIAKADIDIACGNCMR